MLTYGPEADVSLAHASSALELAIQQDPRRADVRRMLAETIAERVLPWPTSWGA